MTHLWWVETLAEEQMVSFMLGEQSMNVPPELIVYGIPPCVAYYTHLILLSKQLNPSMVRHSG
jgi:hypothetical protein